MDFLQKTISFIEYQGYSTSEVDRVANRVTGEISQWGDHAPMSLSSSKDDLLLMFEDGRVAKHLGEWGMSPIKIEGWYF